MCHRVTCPKCKRPTWSGCGQHIEQALAGVPKDERCQCREKGATAQPAAQQTGGSWLSKLMGR